MNEKTGKKPESKVVVKAEESKAVEVKATETKTVGAKPAAVPAASVSAVEAKTTEKPTETKAVVKEEVKKAPKKRTARKPAEKENQTEVFVEYYGQQSSVEEIANKVKETFVSEGHRPSTIKSLKLYLKPEDGSAYYVINEKFAGRVDLF